MTHLENCKRVIAKCGDECKNSSHICTCDPKRCCEKHPIDAEQISKGQCSCPCHQAKPDIEKIGKEMDKHIGNALRKLGDVPLEAKPEGVKMSCQDIYRSRNQVIAEEVLDAILPPEVSPEKKEKCPHGSDIQDCRNLPSPVQEKDISHRISEGMDELYAPEKEKECCDYWKPHTHPQNLNNVVEDLPSSPDTWIEEFDEKFGEMRISFPFLPADSDYVEDGAYHSFSIPNAIKSFVAAKIKKEREEARASARKETLEEIREKVELWLLRLHNEYENWTVKQAMEDIFAQKKKEN